MKTISVTELTSAIKGLLEPAFRSISVQGEISNFKLQTSGHLYFSLKDANSQISAVLFKGSAAGLTRMPKEGDQVIARGEISLYVPRGQYQIVIRELQFLGIGELLLKLHKLKEELEKRGWFDPARKRALPHLPKRIGVITSPTGAVIQDIIHILTRRFSGFHVILNPVKVQGEGAAQEIAQAISEFNKYALADVLIVGRGGGSIEDLWAFNEEVVAKAIFESKIPVISAVGHETDFTIADFVADVRAPTPSAAAEIAIAEKASLLKWLQQTENTLRRKVGDKIQESRYRIEALRKHPLLSSPYALLAQPIQDVDSLRSDLDEKIMQQIEQRKAQIKSAAQRLSLLNPETQVRQFKSRLDPLSDRLFNTWQQIVQRKNEKLQNLAAHLRSVNPQNLLKKGYTLLYQNQMMVSSAKQLNIQEPFIAVLHDGRAIAKIQTIEIQHESKSIL